MYLYMYSNLFIFYTHLKVFIHIYSYVFIHIPFRFICILYALYGGARGVMVIVTGIGHGDTRSNPGRD